jgi:tRNA nucleotidyltransferase (CCA-adding enzyme)
MHDPTGHFPIPPPLRALVEALAGAGGRPVIVGGAVRDWLLGREPKDVDIEVFGLPEEAVEASVARFRVDAVGRSFGVLKVGIDGETFDVALPRRDRKSAAGHRGFDVTPDPNLTFAEAAARRDFTINAIGWDPVEHTLLDPHGGREDLAAQRLRHVGPAFAEDPLRVLRGCQFAARFDLTLAPETIALCRTLEPELATLPKERLGTEWEKLLLRAHRPSIGLDALLETRALSLFPELQALVHVPQDPEWHPEGQDDPRGSLWVHNGMVVDQAVRVLDEDGTTDDEARLVVLLGALCHDLGKPSTTVFEDGRWRSRGHEEAGAAPTRAFLERIAMPERVMEAVIPLVTDHLKPFQLARSGASDGAIRRLSTRTSLTALCQVARADYLGRTTSEALATTDSRAIPEIAWVMERAHALHVQSQAPKPLLLGRHLLDLGLRPGKEIGAILAEAYDAQLEGGFGDLEGALAWARVRVGG